MPTGVAGALRLLYARLRPRGAEAV